MEWTAATDGRISIGTNDRSYQILIAATTILIATAVLGKVLNGISVGPFHLFWFRLYLPLYAVALGWFLWTHRYIILPIPMAGWLLIGFGVYVAISTLWAANLNGLLFGLFALGSALFVTAAVYVTVRDRRTVVLYLLVIFGLVALGEIIALWEIATGAHLQTSRLLTGPFTMGREPRQQATAWFFNRNGFGFFLGLAAGPLLTLAWDSNRGLSARILALCGFVLAVGLIWQNGSRSALAMVVLACGGMGGLSALRPRLRARTPSRIDRRIVTACVFAVALLAVGALLFVPNPFAGVLSLGVRWQLGIEGVQLLVRSKGLGVGVNSFSVANDALGGAIHGKLAPHNWLTALLGEFGVIGTGLFLAAYARILYDIGAEYVLTNDWLRLGLLGTMLSFPVGALGPANVLYTHQSLWVFIGLAAGAAYRA
jgi:hypothetical protein